MASTTERRKGDRVTFERGIPAHMMGIDGTWRRDCTMEDVSETGAKLTIEGSVEGLHLKEFFLLLSSTGLAYRRCELAWVNGDQIGVNFPQAGRQEEEACAPRRRGRLNCGHAAPSYSRHRRRLWPRSNCVCAESPCYDSATRDTIEISRNVRQAHQSHGPRRRSRPAHAPADGPDAEAAGSGGGPAAARPCAGQARRRRRHRGGGQRALSGRPDHRACRRRASVRA